MLSLTLKDFIFSARATKNPSPTLHLKPSAELLGTQQIILVYLKYLIMYERANMYLTDLKTSLNINLAYVDFFKLEA